MSEIYSQLANIQKTLKAPKGQFNSFGNYHYRSCEDILEAVKPLLGDMILTISDEIVQMGNRFYVKATAMLKVNGDEFSVSAYAREEETKKGMDGAQVTGASSSYARKYALNGLFLIDDTKDADTRDNSTKEQPQADKTPMATEGQKNTLKEMKVKKSDISKVVSKDVASLASLTYDEAEKIIISLITEVKNGKVE